jgi:hypothetical protein
MSKVENITQAISPTLATVLEHFGGHGVVELPDHFDRALAFVAHRGSLAEVGEWDREAVKRLLLAGKDQNAVAPICVVDQVLACLACMGASGFKLATAQATRDQGHAVEYGKINIKINR